MKQTTYLLSTALASAILFGMASFQAADAQEYVSKAQVKTLHQAPLQGVAGKEVIVKHFAVPAKFVGGKHMHPGPVFVYVLEGELTVVLESGTKTFKAGELYPEDIGAAMVGKNLSATADLEMLVFQVGDIGKPMMIKVE
ncbi:MAG: cupin domain-containing protein [Deltaproteobacteria bacterium]|nr:cupin domain-containing protein [Deltaproteobacteria bacterium]